MYSFSVTIDNITYERGDTFKDGSVIKDFYDTDRCKIIEFTDETHIRILDE